MKHNDKPSAENLIAENAELRARLEEMEQTLRAINEGEVDAVIVTGSGGERVFSLSEAENLHRLMVETMNEAGLAITPDGMIIFCNNRACGILCLPRERLIGSDLGQFVCTSDADRFRQMLQNCRIAAVDSRIEFLAATGATVPMHVWANYLDRNDIPLICLVATDISRIESDQSLIIQLRDQRQQLIDSRKAALNLMQDAFDARKQSDQLSAALRESEALYRSIGESIDYGVWVCDPDGRNTYASESFLNMVGITQEQCSNFGWGNLLHPDDAERTIAAWQECVRTGGKWDIEHRFRGTDGQWHHVLARGVPVRNEQGEIISWAGINLDISRIKQAEDQLRESLAEKEVLLKEIHHRVKNNLQVISSLISLQADCLVDAQLQGVLGDVRDRVKAMGLVHEKLYHAEDLARLDFAEYAFSLLKNLWSSHSAANGNVRLNMFPAPLILPVEMAVPCGLILNELATNSLKHAFPGGRGGEVIVTLEHDTATGAVCLHLRDNGVGLPADLDWRQTNSLGLRLVQMLAKQMRGTVETAPGPGTEFQINFNVKGIHHEQSCHFDR
jgi:PAS domain S-box-containing protein